MKKTIEETERRRAVQQEYNRINGITPTQIENKKFKSAIKNKIKKSNIEEEIEEELIVSDPVVEYMSREELEKSINSLKKKMEAEAKRKILCKSLMRDEMFKMKKLLLDKFD